MVICSCAGKMYLKWLDSKIRFVGMPPGKVLRCRVIVIGQKVC